MTPAEIQSEWAYRYHERIGLLCGDKPPTERQKQIAKTEADQWVEQWKKRHPKPKCTQ